MGSNWDFQRFERKIKYFFSSRGRRQVCLHKKHFQTFLLHNRVTESRSNIIWFSLGNLKMKPTIADRHTPTHTDTDRKFIILKFFVIFFPNETLDSQRPQQNNCCDRRKEWGREREKKFSLCSCHWLNWNIFTIADLFLGR